VALAGNPNSGKTTIFNRLTGLKQKVGNYPGVTVEKKVGAMSVTGGREISILDLPGTYSLSVRSPDERIARDVLLGRIHDTDCPDLVVCVVDAANLERNLYLVSQILDLGVSVIVALNMIDVAAEAGVEVDVDALAAEIGVPVFPTVGRTGEGVDALKKAIEAGAAAATSRKWRMSRPLEEELDELAGLLRAHAGVNPAHAFSEALILLTAEGGADEGLVTKHPTVLEHVAADHARLDELGVDWRSESVEARYAWIHAVCERVVTRPSRPAVTASDRLDAVLTHRTWGWIAFLLVMGTMFFTIFSVASYPMDWIDGIFAALGDGARGSLPPGAMSDLIVDGAIAGVGSVVIFLPQILILFFFIGLLEDTGYMARAAFIIDRVMSRVGLHGKSFIPLLSSFACAIPGIMATRTIESRKDRLVTILVAPLMSCSARLPVYSVMIATLFPAAVIPSWQKSGIMLSMYLLGMAAAFAMAWLFKRTLLKSETPLLIMELPPYRLPSLKAVALHMSHRAALFLKRAGTVIFALSILVWVLMSYPRTEGAAPAEAVRHSYAGGIGHLIEPVIRPLGFDWRIGVGLVSAFAAREVFVSTMGIVFSIENADETSLPLKEAFAAATWPDGRPLFTPLVCVSVMVFFVLAMQCISTMAVVRRETESWKWPLFQLAYMSGLAYAASLIVYQAGRLIGW
jgi:ferrous iron transport protein B